MNDRIVQRLSAVTEEEREILEGRSHIDRSLYMDGSRDVISGEKLLEKGKSVAIRPHTRFIAFPEHTHDYVEMVYMCAGETRHIVNGKPLTLRQGELLMLGQNARQQIEAILAYTHDFADKQYNTYNRSLIPTLKQNGLKIISYHELIISKEFKYYVVIKFLYHL